MALAMSQLSLLARQHVNQRQGNDSEVRHIIHLKNHQTQTCHMKFMLWSKKTPIGGSCIFSLIFFFHNLLVLLFLPLFLLFIVQIK